jgi:hypothetical protein
VIVCSRSVPVHGARLRVRIVVFGWSLLLRIRLHLVGIPLRARRIRISCGGTTFEVGKLLHPCRERTAAYGAICAVWHCC